MNKKLIPLFLIPVLGMAGWVLVRWLDVDTDDRISLSGNIELTEVNIAFKIPGRLVELTVDEGDPVKAGQVIARLDQQELIHQRDRARATLASAQSRLAQLQTAIRYQQEIVQGQIGQRQAELSQSEARLQELLAGSRTQDIEQARAVVARARTEHQRAQKDWQRAQTLYQNEDISTSQYDQFKSRFESTGASLKQAEEQLALIIEGPRREEIEAGRAQVARAKAGLRLAEAQRLEIKRREQERGMAGAEIDRARAELALIETQLEDTVTRSPIDGVVLVKAVEAGEVLAAGVTVVTVGDLKRPWLRGYINEQDLGRVKLGANVKVTTDSYPGKVYHGRLSFISSEAEFTAKQIQTTEERVKLVYRIKIDIDNPEGELKSNMPADAEILLPQEQAPDSGDEGSDVD